MNTPRKQHAVIAHTASPLLTMREAADVLRFSLRKLQSMRAAGQVRVLVFGRTVRVEQSEVDRLIEEARR